MNKADNVGQLLAGSHDEAAPVADIGVQLRGGIPIVGDMALQYSVFGVNGPRLEVEDGEVEAVEAEGFHNDDNSDKVFGGRLAFRPLPKMEIGFSGQFGEVRAAGDSDRDYGVYDVDFNLTGLEFAPGLDLRAEYVHTRVGSGGTIDPEKDRRAEAPFLYSSPGLGLWHRDIMSLPSL